MTASRNGHPQAADRLLVGGADVDLKDKVNQLYSACVSSPHCILLCTYRLHIVTTWTSPFTQVGWTALMAASQNGSLKVVERLLEKHANPNLPDDLVRRSNCMVLLGNYYRNIAVTYHCNYHITLMTSEWHNRNVLQINARYSLVR